MKEKWTLLATTPLSFKETRKVIAKYFCRPEHEADRIIDIRWNEVSRTWEVYQDNNLMNGFRVISRMGRWRFEGEEV